MPGGGSDSFSHPVFTLGTDQPLDVTSQKPSDRKEGGNEVFRRLRGLFWSWPLLYWSSVHTQRPQARKLERVRQEIYLDSVVRAVAKWSVHALS